MDIKEVILGEVEKLVADFIYYDRVNDEDLPLNAIDNAILTGAITKEEIVEKFKQCLGD